MNKVKKIAKISHLVLYIWSFLIACLEGIFILLNSSGNPVIYEIDIIMFMYIVGAIILVCTIIISSMWLYTKYKK